MTYSGSSSFLTQWPEPEMTLDQDRLSRDHEVITLVQTLPKNRSFYTKQEKKLILYFGVDYWGICVQQVYPIIPMIPAWAK